eukprot:m.86517 g.86517  ORF g.86517 m.86517 type:complete len:82 (+) comp36502_c0_seq4:469-714(+)
MQNPQMIDEAWCTPDTVELFEEWKEKYVKKKEKDTLYTPLFGPFCGFYFLLKGFQMFERDVSLVHVQSDMAFHDKDVDELK